MDIKLTQEQYIGESNLGTIAREWLKREANKFERKTKTEWDDFLNEILNRKG